MFRSSSPLELAASEHSLAGSPLSSGLSSPAGSPASASFSTPFPSLTPGPTPQGHLYSNPAYDTPATPEGTPTRVCPSLLPPLQVLNLTDEVPAVKPARRRHSFTVEFFGRHWADDSPVNPDSSDMSRPFTLVYDGTPGVAGVNHLADYEKHIRQFPSNATCPAVRARTEIAMLAYSYEQDSPFQSWCEANLLPVVDTLDAAIKGLAAEKQTAADTAANDMVGAKQKYKQQFCRGNSSDLKKLLHADFGAATSFVDVIKLVNRCHSLYAVNAKSLPPQAEVIDMLLEKLPPTLSTKVALGLAALPEGGEDNPRQSFKNPFLLKAHAPAMVVLTCSRTAPTYRTPTMSMRVLLGLASCVQA